MATTWGERDTTSTNRTARDKPNTLWDERVKSDIGWSSRDNVATEWGERIRPLVNITPLQDAYTIVADEDNEIIYIFGDSGKLIPSTFWGVRPKV